MGKKNERESKECQRRKDREIARERERERERFSRIKNPIGNKKHTTYW